MKFTKVSEVQEFILKEDDLKTSVRKGKGSMKGYFIIWAQFQNDKYPDISKETQNQLKEKLIDFNTLERPLFCSNADISIYNIIDDRKVFKKERKPKSRGEMKVKQWGSKNSQLRLDKATERNAKRMRKGGTARYY